MTAPYTKSATCFVILAFFACCWASEVQELDMTPNNLETYLKHHPKDVEEGETVHNFGDGFYVREKHVEHLAQHIGNHLKWSANKLRSYANMMDEKKYFTKEWLQDEVDRHHREEGSPRARKERAKKFLESRAHNKQNAKDMWAKAQADDFYEELGTHDPKVMNENLIYDADKDPEYHKQIKIFDDWMAKQRQPGGFMAEPDEDLGDGLGPLLGDEVLLEEGEDEASTDKHWKMSIQQATKSMAMDESAIAAPKKAAAAPKHTLADANMALELRKAGYTENDLKAILGVVAKSSKQSEHRRLGEGATGSCTPGQCAAVLQNHIVDTSAEIQRITGKPVPAAAAAVGFAGPGQQLPVPRGGGAAYHPAHKAHKASTPGQVPTTVVDPVTGKEEPRITIGSSREDLMHPETNHAEGISRDDIRGAMEDEDGGHEPGIDKPANTQADAPAPPYSPPPAPDEIPPGCPATEDRFKSPKCKRYKFMGPFACWSMGQGAHSMAKENAGADFGPMLPDGWYPKSSKQKYVDLSDFRWRLTAGKCMWWNQMYRGMNDPTVLPEQGNQAEGSYKVFRMCMVYSLMQSRHWGAKDEGADYRIALTKGMIQEFASKAGIKVMPESQAFVDALKVFNNDIIGSVWTIIYEFGMSPCVNYLMIFFMIVEAMAGMKAPVPTTIYPPLCRDSEGVYNFACGLNGAIKDIKYANDGTGSPKRILGLKMITFIPPLAFTRPAVRAFVKVINMMEKPMEKAKKLIDLFYETKAKMSDPLDVFWIHCGDFIGIVEILVAIPIKPIQAIIEGLIKTLRLVPVMNIINKVLAFLSKLVFENPISKLILKGPLKVCELVLKAFTQNPIAKGLVGLVKGLMALLDKPIKFSLFFKKFCFTILGILKKVAKMFNAILNKVLGMVKAVLKPIFDLIDKGFKKIASLVKLPKIGIMKGAMGKSQSTWQTLKSIGAMDNPISQHLACSFNLPWVLESGQNLCNCCMLGYLTSQRINVGWHFNDIQYKMLMMKKKTQAKLHQIKDTTVELVRDKDKRLSMMKTLMTPVAGFSKITGKLTRIGSIKFSALRAIGVKAKANTLLNAIFIWFFKGFMCRFQNVGLNPKVMMQLSPLPKFEMFRRRRGTTGKSTTPGMDKCKEYLARRRRL